MPFESFLAESVRTFESLREIRTEIDRAGNLILDTLRRGNKLLICGNGGSAAEAQHFATELVGRYTKQRRSLPAIALSADGSLITCIGNDYGFEYSFARQVEGLGQPGDLFVGITTSGNSPNVLLGLQKARERGLQSMTLLGRGGGKTAGIATVDLIIPGPLGRTAQEAHLLLIHYFCERIDAELA